MTRRVLRIAIATLIVAATFSISHVSALPRVEASRRCPPPRPGCLCASVYAPVTCAGGCVYTNACVADCAGAAMCVPIGPGTRPR